MREKKFSRVQYKMLSEMAAAEVVKLDIPKEIDSLNKQLHKADDARNQLIMDKAIEQAHFKMEKKGKRDISAVSTALGTPKGKRGRRT